MHWEQDSKEIYHWLIEWNLAQSWQPGAGAWYSYLPPQDEDFHTRSEGLAEQSGAAKRGVSVGMVLTSFLFALALSRQC